MCNEFLTLDVLNLKKTKIMKKLNITPPNFKDTANQILNIFIPH